MKQCFNIEVIIRRLFRKLKQNRDRDWLGRLLVSFPLNLPKIVDSRTADTAGWNNTGLVKHRIAGEVARLKKESAVKMVITGGGSVASQLAADGPIDE